MTVSPSNHAARLRLIAYYMGMLTHPDRNLVTGEPDWQDVCREVVRMLYRCTPLTWKDLRAYAVSGRDKLRVVKGIDGRFRFSKID